ncbi:MAG: hypothetical protein H0Z33_02710 [Bacillaceae bacterium]|nr:hypothetical protein [Bacillaceae bacterium]
METVKLSTIVKTVTPELVHFLTREEMDQTIVLQSGMKALEYEDVLEIIQASIERLKKDVYYH